MEATELLQWAIHDGRLQHIANGKIEKGRHMGVDNAATWVE